MAAESEKASLSNKNKNKNKKKNGAPIATNQLIQFLLSKVNLASLLLFKTSQSNFLTRSAMSLVAFYSVQDLMNTSINSPKYMILLQ